MRYFLSLSIAFAMLILSPLSTQAAEAWTVASATTQVDVSVDNQTWSSLRKGMSVPDQAWVATGPRGRAVLVRGSESIIFHPGTVASIVDRSSLFKSRTEVVQSVGVLELEIEKRRSPHTTVQTPFMAAVVKGTRFTVSVAEQAANVSVERGVVEVTSFATGEQSDLVKGQSANVTLQKMTVAGVGSIPAVRQVPKRRALIEPVGGLPVAVNAAGNVSGGAASASGERAADSTSNSSSGGNGKSNAGGNGKSNAGGNGKSNAGGNGKSNAGGNGKSNAGGNGKSNAGGNGKSKAGGNGKSNAGGKNKGS